METSGGEARDELSLRRDHVRRNSITASFFFVNEKAIMGDR